MLTHCTMSCVVLQPYETDSVIDNPISRAALTGMAMALISRLLCAVSHIYIPLVTNRNKVAMFMYRN